MRLVTVNLMSARAAGGALVDVDQLRRIMRGLDADVLAIQEVDRSQPRSGGRDMTAEVADAIGAVDARFAASVVGTPGAQWRAVEADEDVPDDQPAYGIALISRLPVRMWALNHLRAAPVYGPVVVPTERGARIVPLKDEPRVLLTAVLETPGGPLTVGATHLSFVPGWNVKQLRQCLDVLRSHPARRILVGDLNLPSRVIGMVTRWRRLADQPTWPSQSPRIQFDHVLAEDDVRVRSTETRPLDVSDHRAVIVDLDI